MKKIRLSFLFLSLSTGLAWFSSCKDFLEQEPKNSTYNEVFWKDSRAGATAIAGNYALLRDVLSDGFYGVYNRYYIYGDLTTSNYYMSIRSDGYSHQAVEDGNYTANYMVQSYGNWTLFYKAIAMANTIIKEMPQVPDDVLTDQANPEAFRRRITGQAYFIRAYTYFQMTQAWGDVPLVTEAYDDPINAPHLPRTPRMDVMKQIEDDCHKAAELLEWNYYSTGEAHVTAHRGSAYALLAHLYLWRATTADLTTDEPNMTDVNSADTTIRAFLANSPYSQVDTARYGTIFVGNSSEGVFELAMSEDNLEGNNTAIGLKFLNSSYVNGKGADADWYTPPSYLRNHFYRIDDAGNKVLDDKDIRFKNNFANVTATRPVMQKYRNVVYRNPGQQLQPYLSNNMILLRYSDILLLQAEVAIYQNRLADAVNVINGFRTRNGADATQQISMDGLTRQKAIDEYMLERGKEMYMEGHLLFDNIRTRKCFDNFAWLTPDRFRVGGFFWPVDPRLFSENRFLIQTEYWRGRI